MPEAAFTGSWMKSAHKLWVKRLRRTSSLPELLQVSKIFSLYFCILMPEPFIAVDVQLSMFTFDCLFSYNAYITLQVLVDFVGAMDDDWLHKSSSSARLSTSLDNIIVYFQTMPQTTSAVALWVVQLDALIAPYLDKADSSRTLDKAHGKYILFHNRSVFCSWLSIFHS